jgi:hypothetical protein
MQPDSGLRLLRRLVEIEETNESQVLQMVNTHVDCCARLHREQSGVRGLGEGDATQADFQDAKPRQ